MARNWTHNIPIKLYHYITTLKMILSVMKLLSVRLQCSCHWCRSDYARINKPCQLSIFLGNLIDWLRTGGMIWWAQSIPMLACGDISRNQKSWTLHWWNDMVGSIHSNACTFTCGDSKESKHDLWMMKHTLDLYITAFKMIDRLSLAKILWVLWILLHKPVGQGPVRLWHFLFLSHQTRLNWQLSAVISL